MRYISLKNEQNRCNALRGALLLPVGFFRAVFALDGRIGRQGVPNSHQTLTTELSSSTARPSSHNICLPQTHILCDDGSPGAHCKLRRK